MSGHTGHRKHGHGHRSSRRTSSSQSAPSSGQEHPQQQTGDSRPIQVSPSFLFLVNGQDLNEDTQAGGVAPRADPNGFWYPPVYAAGFGRQRIGTLYRWTDGVVTRVRDDAVNIGDLMLYRAVTMFYCNPFYQFFVTDGDASQRNIIDHEPLGDGWYPLHFEYGTPEDTVSYLELAGEYNCMIGNEAEFIHQLGLDSYSNREDNAPPAGGLAGNLAMLIGLVAFSCRTRDLEAVLLNDQAWHHLEWTHHGRRDGRRDNRGLVISVYLDPRNQLGSTRPILHDLERNSGAILS